MIVGLAFAFIWFALALLVHVILTRNAAPASRAMILKCIFGSGFLAMLLSTTVVVTYFSSIPAAHGGWVMGALWGGLAYGAAFALYVPFYYVVAASLSVSSIMDLAAAKPPIVSVAVMQEKYATLEIVAERMTTMAQNGFLIAGANGYQLSNKGRLIARIFKFVKQLWMLAPGG